MKNKLLLYLVLIIILLVGIFASIKLAGQRQELRKKASENIQSSTLTLVGPKQVKVGEKFSVNLILDTTNDPEYTISSVNAMISIGSGGYSPTCIPRPCPAYDLPPNFCQGGQIIYSKPADPCSCQPPPTCIMPADDIKLNPTVEPELTYKQSQDNIPQPMPPKYVTEPISLLNVSPGKIFDNYSYPGSPGLTCGGFAGLKCPDGYFCSYGGNIRMDYPDQGGTCIPNRYDLINSPSNIETSSSSKIAITEKSFSTADVICTQDVKQCPDGSWVGRTGPRCEFASCPGEVVEVTSIPNPPDYGGNQYFIRGTKTFAVDEKGYFIGFSGKGIFAMFNFVANYSGKVEITLADSQILGYRKDQLAQSQTPQKRLLTTLQSINIEVVGEPKPTCIPRPPCLDATSGPRCNLAPPIGGWWCNKEEVFTGILDKIYSLPYISDIRQWGEFKITIGNIGYPLPMTTTGQNNQAVSVKSISYPVSVERAGDSKSVMQLREKMNKYVGQTVKLIGTLENLNLEGGFWGIWAKDVETVTCVPPPDCSIMMKNTDGSEISICDVMGAPMPGTVYCSTTPTPIFCNYTVNPPRLCPDGFQCRAIIRLWGADGMCVPVSTPTPALQCKKKNYGDANCDGVIDGVDYSMWLNSQCHIIGNQTCADTKADFNRDGNVDDDDFIIWARNRI